MDFDLELGLHLQTRERKQVSIIFLRDYLSGGCSGRSWTGEQLSAELVDFAAMSIERKDVTQLLLSWSDGDGQALEQLMPLVADELRRQARGYMAREGVGHTLQPTALVNEVYLRLVDRNRVHWQNRAHFFGFAANTMRRILVDHARKSRAAKRGGGARKITLDEALDVPDQGDVDLIALDEALQTLAEMSPRQSQIVEMRFFAGLTLDETAEVLGIGVATVSRDWTAARAWLFRELSR